jgi:ketosteroid isomerase-like protein
LQHDPIAIVRASYQAILHKDRAALETLLAEDLRFTSPRASGVDRAAYLACRWPVAEATAGFDLIHFAREGDRVMVSYVGRNTRGRRFRNMEQVSVRDGKIVEVEAYFPWTVKGSRRAGTSRRRSTPPAPLRRPEEQPAPMA